MAVTAVAFVVGGVALLLALVAVQITLGALTILSRRDIWINSVHVVCDGDQVDELYVASDDQGEVRRYVWKDGKATYRPTVHYAYCPSDVAVSSVLELRMRNWKMQSRQRILNDEIISGADELGVLLAEHAVSLAAASRPAAAAPTGHAALAEAFPSQSNSIYFKKVKDRAFIKLYEEVPGTTAWHEERRTFAIPLQTREAIIRVGLFGATGVASFDKIEINISRRVNRLLNRIFRNFMKNNSFKFFFWDLGFS